MAASQVLTATVTLTGTSNALNLGTLIRETAGITTNPLVRLLWLQPDGANAGPVYVGGPNVATTNGLYLEAAVSTVPPAPFKVSDGEMPAGVLDLGSIYVTGTNNEKLRVLWVPVN